MAIRRIRIEVAGPDDATHFAHFETERGDQPHTTLLIMWTKRIAGEWFGYVRNAEPRWQPIAGLVKHPKSLEKRMWRLPLA